jgi:predicted unusual protein kinase regulating ubiquinone biosynthesis (AarF/ABC1/UbiB family)
MRLLHICVVLVRHTTAHALTLAVNRVPRLRLLFRVAPLSGPVRLRSMLEDLGGSFIKLGQMLALQPDILSIEYCNALCTLLDRVRPFDYTHVERTFLEEFGRPPQALFDSFSVEPLATASVGQVHVATLAGRKLAVKVRRPSVERDFAGDIRLLRALTAVIRRGHLSQLYWLLEPLDEFMAWTAEELDYRNEARYMTRLRRNAAGRESERIPQVLSGFTTPRTLVAEFLDGFTLLACIRAREMAASGDAGPIAAAGIDSHVVARNIIDNFLAAVFRHGMFHADLHPANLMVLRGNVVGYIDFGITGVISAYSRRNLVALTLAYTSGDLDGMAEAFFRVCRATEDGSPRAFQQGLHELAASWYTTDAPRPRLRKNFTLVMLDMLRLSRRCGVWPDRDVIKYIRSAIAIDGLITRMAPSFDISHHLATVCAEHLRWHIRRTLFTYNTFAHLVAAGAGIVTNGLARGMMAINRVTEAGLAARVQLLQDGLDPHDGWCRDTVSLGVIAFGAALVGSLAPASTLGLNVFTSALVIVVLATAKLVRLFRRAPALSLSAGH